MHLRPYCNCDLKNEGGCLYESRLQLSNKRAARRVMRMRVGKGERLVLSPLHGHALTALPWPRAGVPPWSVRAEKCVCSFASLEAQLITGRAAPCLAQFNSLEAPSH